jgi:molybdopterin converting factor subunit 1
MKVKLLLFAVLSDIIGESTREIEVAEGTRAIDVWSELRAKHPRLEPYERPPFTAVNEQYVDADTVLGDGDEVAFIPPVSGG